MTYLELQNANAAIKTTDIKGKAYAEVPQRIKVFRCLFPEGFIRTELVSDDAGRCVFKASVGYYTEYGERILGTGTAYEKESSSFINKTSYIENCETSAVGRALAMCGIGIDMSVASAEEVQNAMINQAITKQEANVLVGLCNEKNVNIPKLLAMYKVETPEALTGAQYADILRKFKEADKT